MRHELMRLVLSTGITSVLAPAVRSVMLKQGTVDVPNHRSSHSVPVARGGGIACLVGVATGLAVRPRAVSAGDVAVVVGLAAVGLADDRSGGLDPLSRLVAQAGGGILCGLRHSPLTALGGAALMPGVVNVVNFMDGINGISGTTAVVWGTFAALDPTSTEAARAIGAVTAGAGLGFLPHNVPQARLFLGDIGSYMFGALMSVALIESISQPTSALRLGAPLLPYAVDAAQAVYVRARRGEPLFEAHREHVYQRIVDDQGVSHSMMSTAYAVTATFVGLLIRSPRPMIALGGTTATLAAYVASPALLHRLRPRAAR